jgi:Dyp-type peroxidase family
MGIGSDAWDRLLGNPRPAELHPFQEIRAGSRHAVSTPSDLLFHIRAKRIDLCFEMATQIMARLGDAVTAVDEVHGFRSFDDRDLPGFVDGTENPRGEAVIEAAPIGEEDAAFAGDRYVIEQKYLHDLRGWNALSTEARSTSSAAPSAPISIGRFEKADIGAQRAHDDNGERTRQDALRPGRNRRIRRLLHRLLPLAAGDRADDREHVRRAAARAIMIGCSTSAVQ